MVVSGCTTPPEKNTDKNDRLSDIPQLGVHLSQVIQDGIKVPQFSTAGGQLNFAVTGFTDKKRKSAAFRAVASLFPHNRLECGHAALGLAYLHLAPDYRFAKAIDIRKSVNDFKAVLKAYPGFDDIQTKAHWYLGWLHTRLNHSLENEDDTSLETGRTHFRTIVRDYFDVPMNLSPPEPWVNLARPEEFPKIKKSVPVKYWAQAALLELVRCPGSGQEALWAVNLLYDEFFASMETGTALKLILNRPDLAGQIRDKASLWATQNTVNPYLARDIIALALDTEQ